MIEVLAIRARTQRTIDFTCIVMKSHRIKNLTIVIADVKTKQTVGILKRGLVFQFNTTIPRVVYHERDTEHVSKHSHEYGVAKTQSENVSLLVYNLRYDESQKDQHEINHVHHGYRLEGQKHEK